MKLGPSPGERAGFSAGKIGMNERPQLERKARRQLVLRDYSPSLLRFTQDLSVANQVPSIAANISQYTI